MVFRCTDYSLPRKQQVLFKQVFGEMTNLKVTNITKNGVLYFNISQKYIVTMQLHFMVPLLHVYGNLGFPFSCNNYNIRGMYSIEHYIVHISKFLENKIKQI